MHVTELIIQYPTNVELLGSPKTFYRSNVFCHLPKHQVSHTTFQFGRIVISDDHTPRVAERFVERKYRISREKSR